MFHSQELFGVPVYIDHVELDQIKDMDGAMLAHAQNYVYKILQVNSSRHQLESADQGHVTAIVFTNKERTVNILLHRSNNNIFPNDLSVEYMGLNSTTSSEWNFNPRSGDVIVFPGNLKYTVTQPEFCEIFNYSLKSTAK